jgi:hypothetical protein
LQLPAFPNFKKFQKCWKICSPKKKMVELVENWLKMVEYVQNGWKICSPQKIG